MDPTQTIDGPFAGPDPADDEDLMQSPDAQDDERSAEGPGEGDARVMAWARAM
jgi:hypothetical protein